MKDYNLGFIKNEDIYDHVKNTALQYRRTINLAEFNKNIVDPVKLTFDTKIYGQSIEDTIKSECIRQIDKSNNNSIGYFHQHIFKYAGNGWVVPENGKQGGFDILNEDLHIYAEMKNKHNTMNAASGSDTYKKMQNKIIRDDKATCMLVEVIARHSQDIVWEVTVNSGGRKEKFSHERIRRVSVDKFYEKVFNDKYAFYKLCKTLPDILDDVVKENPSTTFTSTVYDELGNSDFYKSLFMLAFNTYEGFENF